MAGAFSFSELDRKANRASPAQAAIALSRTGAERRSVANHADRVAMRVRRPIRFRPESRPIYSMGPEAETKAESNIPRGRETRLAKNLESECQILNSARTVYLLAVT